MSYYTIEARNKDGLPFRMVGPMPAQAAVAKAVELRDLGFTDVKLVDAETLIEAKLDSFFHGRRGTKLTHF